MAEEKTEEGGPIKDTAEAIKGVLQEVPIYKDALQPAAKKLALELKPAAVNFGKAIATVTDAVNVALAPIRGMVWSYQQIEEIVIPHVAEKFKDKLHRLVSPPIFIAGPAVEALRFAAAEEPLRDLYLNLLATSMDEETAEKSLPAFVDIIRQMAPDEAKIVNILSRHEWFRMLGITAEFVPNSPKTYRIFDSAAEILRSTDSYKRLAMIPNHMENLARQRLATYKVVSNIDKVPEGQLRGIHPELRRILGQTQKGSHINPYNIVDNIMQHNQGTVFGLTGFGKQFCEACVV